MNDTAQLIYLCKMAGGKRILFNGTLFTSQASFEKYIKPIIYNQVGICDDIKNKYPAEHDILIELLKRHPDYINKTKHMINLQIQQDQINTKGYKLMIINEDLSETDISWKISITGKCISTQKLLKDAMRVSVDYQIFEFKSISTPECVICSATDTTMHADHIIHFDQLATEFINNWPNSPQSFGDTNDNTHRPCFLESDHEFEHEWIQYHQENATLRILCQTCNLTRSKWTPVPK